MNVAIRVDASQKMGTGHAMRCLTLADALAVKGVQCQFICREHEGNLINSIRDKGYVVHTLPVVSPTGNDASAADLSHSHWLCATQAQDAEACAPIVAKQRPDWLVVDHYALDVRWERSLIQYYHKLMVIDDLADRPHDCDLLLDQNYFGAKSHLRYENCVTSKTLKLLGPRYALLKSEFPQLRSLMSPRKGLVGRVLIFMGGSDSSNQTAKVLRALTDQRLSQLKVDVVIGVNHPDQAGVTRLAANRPLTIVHRNLPSLADLMARADIMIGAGGTTTWERMCLGLPSIVISIAGNQTATQRALHDDGYSIFLGEMGEVANETIADTLFAARNNSSALNAQSCKMMALVGGDGASIVAQIMQEHSQLHRK